MAPCGHTDESAAIARDIAIRSHDGQVDRAGRPYIEHPARVAARVDGDVDAVCAAWLHDVVEDSDTTLDDLREAGFTDRVVHAVDLLTRREPSFYPGGDADHYYQALAADTLALKVKLADLADNSDPARLAALDKATRARLAAKYAHAREVLDACATNSG